VKIILHWIFLSSNYLKKYLCYITLSDSRFSMQLATLWSFLSGEVEIVAACGAYRAKCVLSIEVSRTDIPVKILKKTLKNSIAIGDPPECKWK